MDEPVDIPDDVEVSDYPKYWLPEPVYQVLKWTALVLMPLASVIYTALAGVWGWGGANEIAATLQIVGVAIGVTIGVSELSSIARK
jgi:hypothetical protein|nr:MAG TPA: holin [Caudoviricetes sp.]